MTRRTDFCPKHTRKWDWAVEAVGDEAEAELLLIHLMNAGVIEVSAVEVSGSPRWTFYRYAGLTDAGRELALREGWVDDA